MCTCVIVTKKEFHGLTQVSLEFTTRELLVYIVRFVRVSRVRVGAVGNRGMAMTVLRAVVKSSGCVLAHVSGSNVRSKVAIGSPLMAMIEVVAKDNRSVSMATRGGVSSLRAYRGVGEFLSARGWVERRRLTRGSTRRDAMRNYNRSDELAKMEWLTGRLRAVAPWCIYGSDR